ncbi:hypothetical protein FRC08_018467 [Ceratobasidium sp. 394]|nr:hypothetical protein FRC08_018467 [Ceratobasidium sp. 394]
MLRLVNLFAPDALASGVALGAYQPFSNAALNPSTSSARSPKSTIFSFPAVRLSVWPPEPVIPLVDLHKRANLALR